MRRTLTLGAVAVVALAVVWVALLLTRREDDAAVRSDPGGSVEQPVAGEDVVEVVVLVDEATDPADADRAVGLITDATRMWAGGLEGLGDLDGGGSGEPVDPRDLVVRTERLDTDGVHDLVDPEVVFVVVADVAAAGGATVRVLDRAGAECAAYDDAFALGSWRDRSDFDSHHRLPEGTFDQDCGAPGVDGSDVCLAVNGTFVAGGVDPMEAFGLVGDELGHCLGAIAG